MRGGAAHRSSLAFLAANFQVATRSQRVSWFGTGDPATFKRKMAALYSKVRQGDDAARRELERMVATVSAHVEKLAGDSRTRRAES